MPSWRGGKNNREKENTVTAWTIEIYKQQEVSNPNDQLKEAVTLGVNHKPTRIRFELHSCQELLRNGEVDLIYNIDKNFIKLT